MNKIFIGTGYSEEADISECIFSVENQKDVTITHKIYQADNWMKNYQNMYNEWTDIKEDYDLFIQVDSDVSLKDSYTLKNIAKIFLPTGYNHAIFPLLDFFTNTNIWGLNCYKPSVKFNILTNIHKFDMEYSNYRRLPGISLQNDFVGYHAFNSSTLSAFHFGWHRELKSSVSPGQKKIIQNLKKAYEKEKHINRFHALKGVEYAKKYKQTSNNTNVVGYNNPTFEKYYTKYLYEQSL